MHQSAQTINRRRKSFLLIGLMLTALIIWTPSSSAADGDGDGFDDSIDDCPFAAGYSTTGLQGCPDTDLDGIPDSDEGTLSDFTNAGREFDNIYSSQFDELSGGVSEYTSSSRSSMCRAMAVAPNGMVVFGSDDGNHVYLAGESGNIIHSLFTIRSNPRAIDFSPNGTLLAVAGYGADGNEAVVDVYEMDWNTLSATHVVNLSANHDDDMFGLIFGPDGDRLYIGGKDENVTTYHTSNWSISYVIPSPDDVYAIRTSPDGRLLAFTHGEQLSVYWSENATKLYTMHNNSEYTLGLDWSPDGNWIVTGSNDDKVRIHHAGNGTLEATLDYNSGVNAIAFNRAGTHFVIATNDNDPTWIVRTSDWTVEAEFGDFPGGSGNSASGRRGARSVAWSADETMIYFGARYYAGFYTYYSEDAFMWLGGDVTGQLMETRFREYSDTNSNLLPNHYNSTVTQVTQFQCSSSIAKLLVGASSSTAAESLTTRASNYSVSGMRTCTQSGVNLIEIPVARMPATIMVNPNTPTHQCMTTTGGLSMGQIRWIVSGASQSDLQTTNEQHPGVNWNSIVPNDDANGVVEWRDLHNSCPDEPIHLIHRWENRSVTQMIATSLLCGHCSYSESWFQADAERLRLIEGTRGEIINGAANNDDVFGITELVSGLAATNVYHVPIYDNWTHGAADASAASNTLIHPSLANSTNGIWPFQDDYRLVIREDQLVEIRPFLEWMLSEEGQENFDEIGFVRLDNYSRVLSGDRIGINMRNILPDDDGDGIWNGDDNCPGTLPVDYSTIDQFGCANIQRDTDGDGFDDSIDDCLTEYGLSAQPTIGCPDSDSDGWADTSDDYPSDGSQWVDSDGDGYGDNVTGTDGDACPNESGTSTLDSYGCPDLDGDGWSDLADDFINDPTQWVDLDGDGVGDNYSWAEIVEGVRQGENGDAFPGEFTQHKDRDGDGFGDNPSGYNPDSCPSEFGTSTMNENYGCPDSDGDGWADLEDVFPDNPTQHFDSDGDGYGDSQSGTNPDICPLTPSDERLQVNELGCAPSELDTDSDGVFDNIDLCNSTDASEAANVNLEGCAPNEIDSDGDGIMDSFDAYPTDPTQAVDSDGDGFPDNSSGTNGDTCPMEFGNSTEDRRGCSDSDGDGWSDPDASWSVSDGADILRDNPTQWADSDGDGYYDNYGIGFWANDAMRNQSWPGQYVPNAKDSDRCPLDSYTYQNLQNPGCPLDVFPEGGDTTTDGDSFDEKPSSDGGMGIDTIIFIGLAVIFVIAIGGGAMVLLKSKKSTKKRETKKQQKKTSEDVDPTNIEGDDNEVNLEDDPNYKVDEQGCEWWIDDDGAWWYRTPEMDDWTEYQS